MTALSFVPSAIAHALYRSLHATSRHAITYMDGGLTCNASMHAGNVSWNELYGILLQVAWFGPEMEWCRACLACRSWCCNFGLLNVVASGQQLESDRHDEVRRQSCV